MHREFNLSAALIAWKWRKMEEKKLLKSFAPTRLIIL